MSQLYTIIKVPDPILKEKTQKLKDVNDSVTSQINRMIATMYDAPGIGLAAPQIGILNSIFVMDVPSDGWRYNGEDADGVMIVESAYRSGQEEEEIPEDPNPTVMINPEIIRESEKRSLFQEGCLSIPGQYADIIRPASVRVRYIDENGKQQEADYDGLPSHCVQHEIDHLNGILFIDYLSSLKRNMMIKKVAKLTKQQVL